MNIIYKIKNYKIIKSKKGFTLLELLVYSGILAISAGLISSIVYTVTKANLRTQVEEELNSQLILLEEVFRQKIEAAKGINTITGSLLNLEMTDANKNPTEFTLTNDVAYIQEGSDDKVALNDSSKIKVTSLGFANTGPTEVFITPGYNYAWNGQFGWVNFAYPGSNVYIPRGAGDLSGFAYVPSDGHWISLNCISTNSCATVDYKVSSDADGNLSGWAWSENFGWISFNCVTDNTCSFSDYKTTIDQETGEFDGYAYSEKIGWISFNCKTGGENQTNICSTSDYKVQDLRLRTSAIKIDIMLQYTSDKPELAISRSSTFVFNIITPTK